MSNVRGRSEMSDTAIDQLVAVLSKCPTLTDLGEAAYERHRIHALKCKICRFNSHLLLWILNVTGDNLTGYPIVVAKKAGRKKKVKGLTDTTTNTTNTTTNAANATDSVHIQDKEEDKEDKGEAKGEAAWERLEDVRDDGPENTASD